MTQKKIRQIVSELKSRIAAKYSLKEIRIFGSSARGDRRPESDIDVFVHLSHIDRQTEEDLFDMAYDLELKYDCLIDLIIIDDRNLRGDSGTAPIYEQIRTEGMLV